MKAFTPELHETDVQQTSDEEPDPDNISADELHQLISELPNGYRTVINLYVSADGQIQIDNELTTVVGITPYINKVRSGLSPENQDRLTVSLKADKRTPMGVIADVKKELQKSFALKINYSGTEQ